ncbi:hypothetical protein H920_16565 [Fukomys damarensis]|uniref:Uncharacterized protein n=1 Tax=Fukomys damarensis TaxID=885580 RepID=A0A091DGY6_FUKDA|nr:hypothetical protein H920_16565 [Fukomys damarensis]
MLRVGFTGRAPRGASGPPGRRAPARRTSVHLPAASPPTPGCQPHCPALSPPARCSQGATVEGRLDNGVTADARSDASSPWHLLRDRSVPAQLRDSSSISSSGPPGRERRYGPRLTGRKRPAHVVADFHPEDVVQEQRMGFSLWNANMNSTIKVSREDEEPPDPETRDRLSPQLSSKVSAVLWPSSQLAWGQGKLPGNERLPLRYLLGDELLQGTEIFQVSIVLTSALIE